MGQIVSNKRVQFYDHNVGAKQSKAIFDCIGLSEEDVYELHTLYTGIDDDADDDTLHIEDVLESFTLDSTPFIRCMFDVFEKCRSENKCLTLTFREFVMALWAYCTLSNAAMVKYIFDMYTRPGQKGVDSADLTVMLKDIYGPKFDQNIHASIVTSLLQSQITHTRPYLDLCDFTTATQRYPAILYPCIYSRDRLREAACGEQFWSRQDAYRLKICRGQYYSLRVIVESEGRPERSLEALSKEECLVAVRMKDYDVEADGGVSLSPWAKQEEQMPKKMKANIITRMTSSGADVLRTKSKELAKLLRDISNRGRTKERRQRHQPVTVRAQKYNQDKARKRSVFDRMLGRTLKEEIVSGGNTKPRKLSLTGHIVMKVKPKKKKIHDSNQPVVSHDPSDIHSKYKRERKLSLAQKIKMEFQQATGRSRNNGRVNPNDQA